MLDLLKKDLEKFAVDKFHAISVYALKSNSLIYQYVNYDFIIDNYNGDNNAFIEDLKTETKAIKVIRKRKNGSAYKNVGEPYEVIFQEEAPTPVQTTLAFEPQQVTQAPIQPQTTTNNMGQGMNNEVNNMNFGLNGLESIYKVMDYNAKVEIRHFEEKYEKLKDENEKLSRKIFELETEKKLDVKEFEREENKSKRQNELIGMLAPALPSILEKFAPAQGMAQPQLPRYDAQVQGILDEVAYNLTASTQHESFYVEHDDLLKRYRGK
jgi:hypothetical protein